MEHTIFGPANQVNPRLIELKIASEIKFYFGMR